MYDRPRYEPDERTADALEAVYRTFEMRPPAAIHGCPCCIATRGTDVLLTTPLRQITGQALWQYVSGALLTVGDLHDFRYLLPRILDVSVNDPGNAHYPEVVLGKLSLAYWRTWAADEQRAVEEFIDAWLERAFKTDLASGADDWINDAAEHVLYGAARADISPDRWFGRLAEPDVAPVASNMKAHFPSEPTGFWEEVPAAFHKVRWFLDQRPA